jgi:hypothetical protein
MTDRHTKFMSVTLHHLTSCSYRCARRRLYNNFRTFASSPFDREHLDASKPKNLIEKLGDQTPSRQKGIRRKITGPSVVENSKIRLHLDHIESTKHNLLSKMSSDTNLMKYWISRNQHMTKSTAKYKMPSHSHSRSPRLRRFLKLYGLPSPPSSKGKLIFAEILMKQWGLEPLAKVQEERTDWRENSERRESTVYIYSEFR